MIRILFVMTWLFAVAGPGAARHLLHDVFKDHVVGQRDQPAAVWGTGEPEETVTVSLANVTASAQVDADGRWMVRLPALPAGGPYILEARASGGADQVVDDVLIGDVFLCSGQSNMELQVIRALNAPSEIGASANDRIRMLTVGKATSPAPLDEFPSSIEWEKASPETVRDWSAVCYFFARQLERDRDVPVGLINSSWGGSDIRAWMSAESLSRIGGYDEQLSLLRLYAEDPPAAQRAFGASWEEWWRSRDDTAPWENGADWPPAPDGLGDWKAWGIPELENHHGMVCGRTTIHNAMVAPLGAFGLEGVLWYQGETNTGEAGGYEALLEALMAEWREQFGEDIAVLIVQLANYGRPPVAPAESGWAEVREGQRRAVLGDERAGLAVTIDIGDVFDIHPSNKQEVGRRLYRAARHVIYGEDIPPSGPVVESAELLDDSVVVTFNDVTGSLVALGHPEPIGFELCDADSCRYVDAQIDDRRVVLASDSAETPARVRYCWADSPICTLYDESRLPAGPFEMPISTE